MIIKVASLYTGVGGLDYGFLTNSSYHHVFANDFDHWAAQTFRKNFPKDVGIFYEGPIEQQFEKLFRERYDLLLAGFPCPAWSMAGARRGFVDQRGQEFFSCVAALHVCRPKIFVFENVKGLLSHDGGKSFEFMLTTLKNMNYDVSYELVLMSEYGVSTNRARVIIVGVDPTLGIQPIDLIPPKNASVKDLTLKAVLDRVGPIGTRPNHNLHAPETKMHWIKILREGENLKNLKVDEVRGREKAHGLEPRSPIPKSFQDYRRLSGKDIAPTMMFGHSSLPIHPTENRNLSVRECATIQGFPMDFEFCGGTNAQYKQVGNSVPPEFSKILADHIVAVLVAKGIKLR